MTIYRERFDGARTAVIATVLGALGFMLWASRSIALKGSASFTEIAAAVALPIAAWAAWVRPIIFPYGLYAIVAPLDVLTQMGGSRETTVARLIGLAAAGALLLYAVRTRSVRVPPRATLWIVLLAGWMLLSTLWSDGGIDAGKEAMTLLQLAVFYVIVACYPMRRRDVVPVLAAIVLGGLVSAGVGIYELHAQGFAEAQYLQDYNRINLTVGSQSLDPNLYSDSLLLPFAIALLWFVRTRRVLYGLAALGTMGVLLGAMALAASREAFIALALEIAIVVAQTRAWKRVTLPVLALVGGALVLLPNVLLRTAADAGNGGSGRTSIWHVGLAAFLQNPLFGTGAGSFANVYDRWYLRIFQSYDDGWHRASHDLIVHYGVELGVVGLVLLFGWCISQWLLVRSLPRTGQVGNLRTIVLASLAALALVSFFVDLFDSKFLWLAFALVAQARNLALFGDSA